MERDGLEAKSRLRLIKLQCVMRTRQNAMAPDTEESSPELSSDIINFSPMQYKWDFNVARFAYVVSDGPAPMDSCRN